MIHPWVSPNVSPYIWGGTRQDSLKEATWMNEIHEKPGNSLTSINTWLSNVSSKDCLLVSNGPSQDLRVLVSTRFLFSDIVATKQPKQTGCKPEHKNA